MVRGDSQLGNDGRVAKRLVKRAVYPLFLRRFAACLSVGTRSEEYFQYYGARRVVRAPHFVDNERFASGAAQLAPERDTIRARWGIRPDAVVFLFAGKLMPGKRAQDLIAAVRGARNERVTALIVGDGVTRRECEELAAPVADRVRFAGFLNQGEMPAAYAASDVLVLPSESETWGLVVNEAMASGRPAVVSTAVGCAPDLITEGETGHTFAPGDAAALPRILDAMASDDDRLAAMSLAARSRVSSFSVDAARAGVEAAVRGAVAERP